MSEEIKNTGTEINEAALEDVGGGYVSVMLTIAKGICERCKNESPNACNGGSAALLAGKATHGFPPHYTLCPYYRKPEG